MTRHEWTLFIDVDKVNAICVCGSTRTAGVYLGAIDLAGDCPGAQATSHQWTSTVDHGRALAACRQCGGVRSAIASDSVYTAAPLDLSGECPAVAVPA